MAQALTTRPLEQLLSWPPEGLARVPMQVYSDPEIYAWEQDRIFRGPTWHLLCLENEVPAEGDYVTTYLGDTSIIVVRESSTGSINALVNRCAHKGTALCYRQRGNVPRFTCPYHNWIYEHSGELKSISFERGIQKQGGMPPEFDKSKHGLTRLRTACVAGLVFGTFSTSAPPLEEYFGANMVAHLRRTLHSPLTILGRYCQSVPNNWKLHMENTRDTYHPSLLHTFFTTFKLNRLSAAGEIIMDARGWHHASNVRRHTDGGNAEYTSATMRTMKADFGLQDSSVIDQVAEYEDGITNSIQTMFPGFILFQVSNCIGLRQVLPRGPERCDLMWTLLGFESDTEELTAVRVKHSNLVGPAGYISMEDGMIGGLIHRGIRGDLDASALLEMGGASNSPGTSRATEASVRTFWRAYREVMGV